MLSTGERRDSVFKEPGLATRRAAPTRHRLTHSVYTNQVSMHKKVSFQKMFFHAKSAAYMYLKHVIQSCGFMVWDYVIQPCGFTSKFLVLQVFGFWAQPICQGWILCADTVRMYIEHNLCNICIRYSLTLSNIILCANICMTITTLSHTLLCAHTYMDSLTLTHFILCAYAMTVRLCLDARIHTWTTLRYPHVYCAHMHYIYASRLCVCVPLSRQGMGHIRCPQNRTSRKQDKIDSFFFFLFFFI